MARGNKCSGFPRDERSAVAYAGESAYNRASFCAPALQTSGYLGRSSFSGDYRRPAAPRGDFGLVLVRDLRGMKRSRRSLCQIHLFICRTFTGATGLEPATSGVTAGHGASGLAGIGGDLLQMQGFRTGRCGDYRASAGTSGGFLRDLCRMRRCLSGKRCGICARCLCFSWRTRRSNSAHFRSEQPARDHRGKRFRLRGARNKVRRVRRSTDGACSQPVPESGCFRGG
jgi:hypothetical protein